MSKTRLFSAIKALDVEAVSALLDDHPGLLRGDGRAPPQPAPFPLRSSRERQDLVALARAGPAPSRPRPRRQRAGLRRWAWCLQGHPALVCALAGPQLAPGEAPPAARLHA